MLSSVPAKPAHSTSPLQTISLLSTRAHACDVHAATLNRTARQVAQLKNFLRQRLLPVSGKKEILVNRLLQAARDVGHLPQVPPSPAPTSPSGSDISFSLPGRGTPAPAAAAPASVDGHRSNRVGAERKAETAEGLSREARDIFAERSTGIADAAASTAEGDTVAGGGAVEGESGGRRPAAAAGQQQTTLRERLEARVQERDLAAKRKADASSLPSSESGNGDTRKAGISSSSSSSRVNSGAGPHQAKSRPAGGSVDRRGVTSATQGKSSAQSSSSQQRAIDAGKAAVAAAASTTTMGPPAARKPLGVLGIGNGRNGSSGNERAGAAKAVVKPKPSAGKVQGGTAKQPTGGNTTAQRNPGQAGASRSSVTGALRTSAGGGSPRPVLTGHKATAAPSGSIRPGKVGRVSPSSGVSDPGRSKDARNAAGGPKRPAVAPATASDQRKRAKVVDSATGVPKTGTAGKAKAPSFVRPTKSSGGAPSFMKPTKTSGARALDPEE